MEERLNDEIILRPNKIKWSFFAFIFLIFFSFSMYMIFFYPGLDGKVMGGGVSFLISAGLFFLLYKTSIWKASLILNKEGIFINNLPKQKRRLVPWNNIKSISKFRQMVLIPRFPYRTKQDYIVVYLTSSQEDFSKDKESLGIRRYRDMQRGGQILIPLNSLPCYSADKNLNFFRNHPVKVE